MPRFLSLLLIKLLQFVTEIRSGVSDSAIRKANLVAGVGESRFGGAVFDEFFRGPDLFACRIKLSPQMVTCRTGDILGAVTDEDSAPE